MKEKKRRQILQEETSDHDQEQYNLRRSSRNRPYNKAYPLPLHPTPVVNERQEDVSNPFSISYLFSPKNSSVGLEFKLFLLLLLILVVFSVKPMSG